MIPKPYTEIDLCHDVARHWKEWVRYAERNWGKNRGEDIVAESLRKWLVDIRRGHVWTDAQDIHPKFKTILHNTAIDYHRREDRRRHWNLPLDAVQPSPALQQVTMMKEEFQDAFMRLCELCQFLLLETVGFERTAPEIIDWEKQRCSARGLVVEKPFRSLRELQRKILECKRKLGIGGNEE